LSGAWDDAVLSAEQGSSAAAIHPRQYELPMLHLAVACVSAGRGFAEDAERHAKLAEEVAESLDYDHERLFAAMTRALVCQASGDCPGMASALRHWQDDTVLDDRSWLYGVLWRPLLIEGLVGSGRTEEAGAVLRSLAEQAEDTAYLEPALAWLEGWLAEERGAADAAREIYRRGEEMACRESPVYVARLLLAYGRFLRRTGQRREALERLRRAIGLYSALQASPFVARAEMELAACGLPHEPTQRRSVLDMTRRESGVARLIVQRQTNSEIAAELFITPATVEYHLGNIYAKFGVKGRQQLRRVLADAAQTAAI
jgi:DNA-binding CsgD family transcriptional regulator